MRVYNHNNNRNNTNNNKNNENKYIRRVSMQSLFPETDRRRGSLLKERVLELFHENEVKTL